MVIGEKNRHTTLDFIGFTYWNRPHEILGKLTMQEGQELVFATQWVYIFIQFAIEQPYFFEKKH